MIFLIFCFLLIQCHVASAMKHTVNVDNVIIIDDSEGFERLFEGIGGLSGGGATSKLLVNYPVDERNQILDYLFKPNFGASLQILKVEIGGDAQSTDGTEASHMHYKDDENYSRGYEWWLMKEAKKRNPDIKLYGLPWTFPGWIGRGTQNPYLDVEQTADYVVGWINGAKTIYNLTIDYIGIWNERNYSVEYIKILRKTLDQRGYQNVMIIAADGKWNITEDILTDPVLADAVYAVGAHYPGTYSPPEAYKTNKRLWASEDYNTFNDETGGGCWARLLNQNYVNGLMTSTISWNLVVSYYAGLPYYRTGLMTAFEPWSGNYVVNTPIWITAHTTQFTSIGWRYLRHGSGVGHLPQGGSYVSLVSPDGQQLTIVIETMTHNHSVCIRPSLPPYEVIPQIITIKLQGSFEKISSMNLWYSKLNFDGRPDKMFENIGPLQFIKGQATLLLGLDEVFTLTTLSRGMKGHYSDPPPSASYPLPYMDDFEAYSVHQEANNLAQQTGAYEVVSDGQNQFIRQMVLDTPVAWCDADLHNMSINIIGQTTWSDIFIQVDFRIPPMNSTSGVFVASRMDQGGCGSISAKGIYLFVYENNSYVLYNDFAKTKLLLQGTVTLTSGWHTLSLLVKETSALGAFDGNILFNVTIPNVQVSGFAALGTDSYGLADFDNLLIDCASNGQDRFRQYNNLYH